MLNPTMPRVKKASGKSPSVSTVIERLKVNSGKTELPDGAKIKIENTIKYLKQCQAMQNAGW